MNLFGIQSADHNHAWVLGFSSNLFCILDNIHTEVGIMCGWNSYECVIYAWLIVIDLSIGNKIFCGKGGKS